MPMQRTTIGQQSAMQPGQRTLQQWTNLLNAAAKPAMPAEFHAHLKDINREDGTDTPPPGGVSPEIARALEWIATFSDNAGHRRDVDRPLLCEMLGSLPPGDFPPNASHLARAWYGLFNLNALDSLAIDWDADGPLLPSLRDHGIELWTEAELGTLHALTWRGMGGRNKAILERAWRAAAWMLEELQPDNATNHPWGLHVFVVMALDPTRTHNQRGSADLYAQTLLHNAIVSMGKPDRFSACILWDAAQWLSAVPQVR